jgi:hypothetical protein
VLAVAPLIEPRLLYHRYVYELVPPEAVAVKVPGVVLEQTGELPPPIVAVRFPLTATLIVLELTVPQLPLVTEHEYELAAVKLPGA